MSLYRCVFIVIFKTAIVALTVYVKNIMCCGSMMSPLCGEIPFNNFLFCLSHCAPFMTVWTLCTMFICDNPYCNEYCNYYKLYNWCYK